MAAMRLSTGFVGNNFSLHSECSKLRQKKSSRENGYKLQIHVHQKKEHLQGAIQRFTSGKKLILPLYSPQQLLAETQHFKGKCSLLSIKLAWQTDRLKQQPDSNSRQRSSVQCLSSKDGYLEQDSTSLQGTPNSVSTVDMFEGENHSPSYSSQYHNTSKRILTNKPKKFKNKYLGLVRLGSVINNAVESFFKSEIRRRLFVTVVLVMASRAGYFIPLPGFDRRLIPEDYLGFVSGSVEELGDLSAEVKLSLFQLGISPHIFASIVMQVLCHFLPSLIKLRKEGLNGHEKLKTYTWRLALGVAILESLAIACHSLSYSVYAASHRVLGPDVLQHIFKYKSS